MRSRYRTILVAFVAMLAVGAFAAASASAALPEFTGTFPNQYESTIGSTEFVYTGGPGTLTCRTGTGMGSITGAKTITQELFLKGCEGFGFSSCSTTGAAAGEIRTNAITGTLVYLSKTAKEVGIAYPRTEVGVAPAPLATVHCAIGGGTVELRGTLLGKITPVNTLTSHFQLKFRASAGKQTPASYEYEGLSWSAKFELSRNGSPFAEAGLVAEGPALVTRRAIEIKA